MAVTYVARYYTPRKTPNQPKNLAHNPTPKRLEYFLAMATTSGGHTHRHHHHGSRKPPLCAGNDSPDKVHFKQLKPRVGFQFQTRVPKLGSAGSSRPAPEHTSTEDLYAIEVDEDEVMFQGEDVCACVFVIDWSSARESKTCPVHPQRKWSCRNWGIATTNRGPESNKKQQHCFICDGIEME